ncbi:hypothetical protein HDU97_006443 [Phlyctochytrium planicorne]|nr:hypothetical protein HDU97_006443 [Phlyctochytrium planicorne]
MAKLSKAKKEASASKGCYTPWWFQEVQNVLISRESEDGSPGPSFWLELVATIKLGADNQSPIAPPPLPPMPVEVINLITKDTPRFIETLKGMDGKIKEVQSKVEALQSSLLELKTHGLLSYMTHLSLYLMMKVQGQRIESHPSIDQMIEHRVVMERARPLEQKLKYQIDKLLRTVATSVFDKVNEDIQGDISMDAADPLQFKPNPENLVSAGDAKAEGGKEEPSDGIYRPPKVAPVPYEEKVKSKGKLSDREKDRSAKSRIIHDLAEQLDNRPEEKTTFGTGERVRERKSKEEAELDALREREEETFTRFTSTKAQRKAEERRMRNGGISGLTDEIEDLERDFLSIRSVDNAIAEEDLEKFGLGVTGKRKRTTAILQERSTKGAKKTRFDSIDQVLSHNAKGISAKSQYEKQKRRLEKPRKSHFEKKVAKSSQ